MNREFTGRKMATILVAGFAVVVAVNLVMATYAVSGFGGVIVDNSYVASQKFNGWLEEAEKARALGWQVEVRRDDAGFLVVNTAGVPAQSILAAQLRRPLGASEQAELRFAPVGDGQYRSTAPVSAGRWTVRLTIEAGQQKWANEGPLG